MGDSEIYNYLKQAFSDGKTKDQVTAELIAGGWSQSNIDKTLVDYNKKINLPQNITPTKWNTWDRFLGGVPALMLCVGVLWGLDYIHIINIQKNPATATTQTYMLLLLMLFSFIIGVIKYKFFLKLFGRSIVYMPTTSGNTFRRFVNKMSPSEYDNYLNKPIKNIFGKIFYYTLIIALAGFVLFLVFGLFLEYFKMK